MSENRAGIPKRESGQSIVEFALVLPVLLLLLFGIFEFGRALFIYSAVFTASREAARYGSAAGMVGGSPLYNDCPGIRAAAQRVGTLAGIQADDITIKYDSGPGTPILPPSDCPIPNEINVLGGIHRIIVEVSADFNPIVPLVTIPPAQISSKSARTILNSMSVKSEIPIIPTPTPGKMHVGDLHATRFYTVGGSWGANVTITVHDAYENPVQGVTVVGVWGNGTIILTQCDTDYSGKCTTTSGDIDPTVASTNFTVFSLNHPYHNFDASDNHDPGGEDVGFVSDGNTITIPQP